MATNLSEMARTFLQEQRFVVLATLNADGSPHLSAMWFLLDGDTVIMNTIAGRVKERNMRRDPRISLCVEHGGYVTLTGMAEFVDDRATAIEDMYRLVARYEGEEVSRQAIAERFVKEQRVAFRLRFTHAVESLR